MGVSENRGVPYFRVLINRILLFRVLYWGPLFPEIPILLVGVPRIHADFLIGGLRTPEGFRGFGVGAQGMCTHGSAVSPFG